MKRDWDIVREILLEIESGEKGMQTDLKHLHGAIMWKAGLIEGVEREEGIHVTGLTWFGHELLDTIRHPGIWTRIKSRASECGVGLTVDSIMLIVKKYINDHPA